MTKFPFRCREGSINIKWYYRARGIRCVCLLSVRNAWIMFLTFYSCIVVTPIAPTLHWRHHGRNGISNHQPHNCLLTRLLRRRSKKTWKLRATGLCAGNSPVTGEFPAPMASNAENVSIWWRHHENDIISVSVYVKNYMHSKNSAFINTICTLKHALKESIY